VDRKPTFAFVARSREDRHVFEYVPTRCEFAPAHTDGASPRTAYLAGLECWASDLLAVLDGALGPIALTYGRARLWNALPQRFRFDIFGKLYRVSPAAPARRVRAHLPARVASGRSHRADDRGRHALSEPAHLTALDNDRVRHFQ
jgi:hypothetical protein